MPDTPPNSLALTWNDVDLLHQVIHVTKAIDTVTGALKTTKSTAPRKVPIEPALLPLLVALKAETNGQGRVVPFPTVEHHAVTLREMLGKAGVRRSNLFTSGPSVKPIRFHDLRATGITWMAVRGDDPVRIQYRAGHSDLATTQIYIREVEDHKERVRHRVPVSTGQPARGNRSPVSITRSATKHESRRFMRRPCCCYRGP